MPPNELSHTQAYDPNTFVYKEYRICDLISYEFYISFVRKRGLNLRSHEMKRKVCVLWLMGWVSYISMVSFGVPSTFAIHAHRFDWTGNIVSSVCGSKNITWIEYIKLTIADRIQSSNQIMHSQNIVDIYLRTHLISVRVYAYACFTYGSCVFFSRILHSSMCTIVFPNQYKYWIHASQCIYILLY